MTVLFCLSGLLIWAACGCSEKDTASEEKPRVRFRISERKSDRPAKPDPQPTATALPEPERRSAPTFSLHIAPTNAAVILTRDGQIIYQTNGVPVDGFTPDVPPGDYQMLVSAAGYDVLKDSLTISPRKGPAYITLVRLKGLLRVQSDPETTVTLKHPAGDIAHRGVTSVDGFYETTLPEGDYTLVLKRDDFYPAMFPVAIDHTQIADISSKLRAIPSRLWIASSQPAEVWKDGKKIGTTEATLTNLTAGSHTFTLRSPGYNPQTITTTIPPNSYVPLEAPTFTPAVGALYVSVTSSVPNDTFFGGLQKVVTVSPKDCKRTVKSILFRNVKCGSAEISATVKGYTMRGEPIALEVQNGLTNVVQVVMDPKPAEIKISCAEESAQVYRNGKLLAEVNEVFSVPPFAAQTLTVREEQHADKAVRIPALNPETVTTFTVELEPEIQIEDLIANNKPILPSVRGLATGAQPAQLRQKQLAGRTGLPIEVKTARSGITLRLIPSGRFRMGSPVTEEGHNKDEEAPLTEENEETRVAVRITEPLYVSATEITRDQWKTVMGEDPAVMKGSAPTAPVESINWNECQTFLDRLCQLEGVPAGTYRLLTEAEWEYCCRAGTQAPTYIGACFIEGENNSPDLDEIAWYAGNSGVTYDEGWSSIEWPEKQYPHRKAGTHPVAQKRPNAWGLYDTIGGVWEWTSDRYIDGYNPGPLVDPKGPDRGNSRVCRGGAWYTRASRCRAAERYRNSPLYRDSNLGLRIARRLPAR